MSIATEPTAGGRVELSLEGQSPDGFVYEVHLFWRGGQSAGRAEIKLPEGTQKLTVDGAPDWLVRATTQFLKVLAKDAREGDTLPRRLTRWRDEPAAAPPV